MKYILIIIIVLVVILYFAGNYFYNLAINPKFSKDVVFNDDFKKKNISNNREIIKRWIYKESKYEDVYINSFDGMRLHGFKILNENKNNKWAIVVHGYSSNVIKVGSIAKKYVDMGYNVIMPELRSHGESEGDYIGMGWHDRLDIINWINLIINENHKAKIVLHGSSMGAATVMMTSGEDLPQNVKAIIADCGYTSAIDQFSHQLKSLFKLPSFPVLNMANFITRIKAGYSLRDASSVNQLKKCVTPILFIHGDKDEFVPYYMMDELYDSVRGVKEKLTISGAGHEHSRDVNPTLYWNTVSHFLNKYMD